MPEPRPVSQRNGRLGRHDVSVLDALFRKAGPDGMSLDALHAYIGEVTHELHTDGVNYPIETVDTLDGLRKQRLVARKGDGWRITRKGAQALRDVGAPR